MKREPNKQQIKLWNRLVKEVFNHPNSRYSIFVYEMIKRRVLGTFKEEFRGSIAVNKKLRIDCLMLNDKQVECVNLQKKNGGKKK